MRIHLVVIVIAAAGWGQDNAGMVPGTPWRLHDMSRPAPTPVTSPTESTQERPGTPPSDAILLFDGKDLSHWRALNQDKTGEPEWKVENGYAEVAGTGHLLSKESFGSGQYHVEWAAPVEIEGAGQERGNSGVYLMGRYEIQILDSWKNPTYADGYAGAVYGQAPPMVNPSRKPGEWQVFDIYFEAPKFSNGRLTKPAFVTVVYNGLLVQNHVEILGVRNRDSLPGYSLHTDAEPLKLQNHSGAPVRFRNIWVRPARQ